MQRDGREGRDDGERVRRTPGEHTGGHAEYPPGYGRGVGAFRGLVHGRGYDPGAYDRQLYRHEDYVHAHREVERYGMRDEGDLPPWSRGPHYGKGPKGYTRSDARIREDVCERIAEQAWVDASEVEVRVEDGEVTLSGSVASRSDKRALERMIDPVLGVKDLHNQLRVARPR